MTDRLPPGWVLTPVTSVLESFNAGVWGTAPQGAASTIQIVRNGDISAGGSVREELPIRGIRPLERPKIELRTGDVLVATSGDIGKCAIWPSARPNTGVSNFVRRLRTSPALEPGYLYYWIRSARVQRLLSEAARGVTIRNLPVGVWDDLQLPLPPLAEQRRIMEQLDELLASNRSAQGSLDAVPPLIEQYRKSVLAAAIDGALTSDWRCDRGISRDDWQEVPWSEVGRCQNGRAFPSAEYAENGVKLLRPGNLHVSGQVEWTDANTRYMEETWATRHPGVVVGPGEIVMNLTAQSLKDEFLGRVCMTGPGERCLLNQRIARLTPTEIDARYAFWVFKSPRFRHYVDGLNTGSLIQHMFTSQVDQFALPVPGRAEQAEIVRRIEELLGRTERLAQRLSELPGRVADLERSALAKAFRGELVPQDPDDEPAAVLLERIRTDRAAAVPMSSTRRRRTRA